MTEVLSVFSYFLSFRFILFVFFGALSGMFVGAVPGLSISMATALLVSITYTWDKTEALAMIIAIYVVGVFSGSISAVLLNIPGAPSSVVTTLDGYPLAKKGKAELALRYIVLSSFFGSLIGIAFLWLLAKPLSILALSFAPMDYFLMAVFGLIMVSTLDSAKIEKGILSAGIGILFSFVGMDFIYGTPRFTFGIHALNTGIGIAPALIGLFGISEVFWQLLSYHPDKEKILPEQIHKKPSKIQMHYFIPSFYYGILGTIIGAIPGAGAPVASFFAYHEANRITKNPKNRFGEGAIEGIIASETANNACIGGALIPTLTLAVPGDAVTAILLSVFYLHNIKVGPRFILESPKEFHAILAASLLASGFLLLFGWFFGTKFGKILQIRTTALLPSIFLISIVGAFAFNHRYVDLWISLGFGILGFLFKYYQYPIAPLTLGLVLGRMMDENFRRAVSFALLSDNMLSGLFLRPITFLLLGIIVLYLIHLLRKKRRTA